jgi:hypothetical protein
MQPVQPPTVPELPRWWSTVAPTLPPSREALARPGEELQELLTIVLAIGRGLQEQRPGNRLSASAVNGWILAVDDKVHLLFCHPQPSLGALSGIDLKLLAVIRHIGYLHEQRPLTPDGTAATWVPAVSRWLEIVVGAAEGYRRLALLGPETPAAYDWFATHLPDRRRYEWIAYLAVNGSGFADTLKLHRDIRTVQRTLPTEQFTAAVAKKLAACGSLTPLFERKSADASLKGQMHIVEETEFVIRILDSTHTLTKASIADGSYLTVIHTVDVLNAFTTADKQIFIRATGGTIGTGVHEALHLLCKPVFANALSTFIIEGVIEYLARRICGEQIALDNSLVYAYERRVISSLIRDGATTDAFLFQMYVEGNWDGLLATIGSHGGPDARDLLQDEDAATSSKETFDQWCVAVRKEGRRPPNWQPADEPAADQLVALITQQAPGALALIQRLAG